jgi:hypothetical protein
MSAKESPWRLIAHVAQSHPLVGELQLSCALSVVGRICASLGCVSRQRDPSLSEEIWWEIDMAHLFSAVLQVGPSLLLGKKAAARTCKW